MMGTSSFRFFVSAVELYFKVNDQLRGITESFASIF